MKITPTALTITQLLSTQSEQFVVPAYQRRYSWQAKHIRELFDDVNQLDDAESHLLGSIVCLTSAYSAGLTELELVDGQQRTTTIMLFLNVIEVRLLALGKDEDAKNIGNYLYCQDYTGAKSNKLKLGDLDNKDFSLVMANRNLDDVVNKNLLEAHQLITTMIEGLSDDELAKFKYKFINQASIIRLDVAESKDAFKLFETINNRGLTLSPADIIKNFLLGNASLVDDATLEAVKDDWTKLVVSLDGINMDDFFRQYMIGLRGRKVPSSQLIDTFKKYYALHVREGAILRNYQEYSDGEGEEISSQQIHITEFVADLRKAAEIYRQIVTADFKDQKFNRHLDNLRRIRSVASYIFVLNLMGRDLSRKDILAILGMLETFMLRRNVAEYRTNELEDIFARLTKLPDEHIVENCYVAFRDNLPSNGEFYTRLMTSDFKGQLENRAKYMLEQIEYHITGNTGEKYIGGGEDVHLEHIMPQTIDTKKSKEEYGDWQAYLGVENAALHGDYVAKFGNLTLLAAPLNIRASNNPFKSKQFEGVEGQSEKGKETDYSKSDIVLTRKLLDYDEFKFDEIIARSEELAQLALEIWKLPTYKVSEQAVAAAAVSEGLRVYCTAEGTEASGLWFDDGRIIVSKGSTAVARNSGSFSTHNYRYLKERLLKNGKLIQDGEYLIFAEDYEFDSPSAAAAVVLGRPAAGPSEWKDASGKTLKALLKQ